MSVPLPLVAAPATFPPCVVVLHTYFLPAPFVQPLRARRDYKVMSPLPLRCPGCTPRSMCHLSGVWPPCSRPSPLRTSPVPRALPDSNEGGGPGRSTQRWGERGNGKGGHAFCAPLLAELGVDGWICANGAGTRGGGVRKRGRRKGQVNQKRNLFVLAEVSCLI